jgi:hypothetical protein
MLKQVVAYLLIWWHYVQSDRRKHLRHAIHQTIGPSATFHFYLFLMDTHFPVNIEGVAEAKTSSITGPLQSFRQEWNNTWQSNEERENVRSKGG